MTIKLHHHPFSRAANVVWMLEEVGVPYELSFVDFAKGEHKSPEFLAKNPMGKLPVLEDGEVIVTESAAIALYLGDRYSSGKLAPLPSDPSRGTYLRWAFFAPGVIEPGAMARASKWEFREGAAGWGNHDAMLATIEHALTGKDYLLGSEFSMADVVFGGTLRYMVMFKMLEPTAVIGAYSERIGARPAWQRAQEINNKIREERGLKPG